MRTCTGLVVCCFLTFVSITAGNAGTTGAVAPDRTQPTGQETADMQGTPNNKPTLSKRNQAKIKQVEAAKIKNANKIKPLSKHNQAKIKQTEAAKEKRDKIRKSTDVSTQ